MNTVSPSLFSRPIGPALTGVAICVLAALTGCQQVGTQADTESALVPRTASTANPASVETDAKVNATTAYVQASLARVRAAPDTDAKTLAQVVTNTPVKRLAERQEWCEVEVSNGDILTPAEPQTPDIHGFIACRLLSAEPLTLAKVEAQIANAELDARELLNWQSRAFWIAPSLTRWAAVGTALEMLYLDEATRNKEIEAMRPPRFKVEEFELMKQRLAAGITITPESYHEMWWQILHNTQLGEQAKNVKVLLPPIAEVRQRVKFPEIKPSHFKNDIPVIVPALEYITPINNFLAKIPLIDALSAYNGTSFQVEILTPAFFAAPDDEYEDENEEREFAVIGLWDVGGVRITFNGDALLYGITERGEPTARNLKTITLRMSYGRNCKEDGSCDTRYDNSDQLHSIGNNPSVAGYAPVPPLVRWAGKPMPGGAAAKAQVKTRKLPDTDEDKAVTVHEIDLNRDGVADLLVLQGHVAQYSGMGERESVFANINGQWLQIRVRRRLTELEESLGLRER
ncbi:hypothetical protein AGMMS49960_11990 [Betaproteobacteria bacterium]|nr:hypothetical protein AGMMS49543_16910 [Betaproteobacteria bacterium]GHU01556.1 hypothetical protein AGMMS49960_11990 [Betaproteobacteria bacterium]GHU16639.1 hypothetical protein AGMMS50243_03250 [Betaproteobacteria bacterium]